MASASSRRRRIRTGNDQAGQGLVEYALILMLIAVVAIGALMFLGSAITGYLSDIGNSI
jgi:pilus assembly protein Flp/PilA